MHGAWTTCESERWRQQNKSVLRGAVHLLMKAFSFPHLHQTLSDMLGCAEMYGGTRARDDERDARGFDRDRQIRSSDQNEIKVTWHPLIKIITHRYLLCQTSSLYNCWEVCQLFIKGTKAGAVIKQTKCHINRKKQEHKGFIVLKRQMLTS